MTVKELKEYLEDKHDDLPILAFEYDGMNIELSFATEARIEKLKIKEDKSYKEIIGIVII